MAEYRQLEDGSFVKRRASGWEPVSAEEVAAQDQGRLERGGRAILGGAESLVRGGAAALDELVGDPRGPMAPESAAENLARWKETQAELEGISKVDPAVGLLRYAPETVVGSAGLGTGLGVRAAIGGEAALGAGLGAASDPEHPLRGAAIGGVAGGLGGAAGEGLGQMARGVGRTLGPAEQRLLDVVTMRPGQRRGNSMAADIIREADRVAGAGGEVETIAAGRDRLAAQMGNNPLTGARSMPADPAAAAGRRSVGAAEVTGDTQPHLGGGRQLEGLADSTEMLDSGFPMSETQARILDTPDGLELQQLRSLDDMEDVQSRTRPVHARVLEAVGAAPKGMDRAELAHEQQAWLNKYVSEEFGITGRSALTPGSVQQRMGELNAEFERIIGETPGPIDMKGVNQEWERILDKNMLRQGNPAYAEAEREYVDLASRVEKDAGGNLKSGDPRKLAQMRNKLTAKIDAAKSKPRLQEVAEVLEELRDVIDERFRKNWTPEMAEDHGRAQKQWWIGKALQKTGAAVGARGDVNLPTFMSNYEGSGAGRKTALLIAANRDFYRKLRGASAVMMKETGNTGSGQTAAQGMAALAGDTLMSMIPGGSLLRGLGGR